MICLGNLANKADPLLKDVGGDDNKTIHDPPLLFNLNVDPSEKHNIASEHPDIITEICKILVEHLSTLVLVENQLEK